MKTNPNVEDRRIRELTVRVPARLHEHLKRRAACELESEAAVVRRALRRELLGVREQLIETR